MMKCDTCLGVHITEDCPFNKPKPKEPKDWLLWTAIVLLTFDAIIWLTANVILAIVVTKGK